MMKKAETKPVETQPAEPKRKPASEGNKPIHDNQIPPEVKRQLNRWHSYMAEVEATHRRSIGG
jgi:hypothetical protein